MTGRAVGTRRLEGAVRTLNGPNQTRVGTAFGLTWYNGHAWGVAHPDANCYADAGCASVDEQGRLHLGVALKPQTFNGRQYPWAVGLVRSAARVLYGELDVTVLLPLGRNLLPAVWLYDDSQWPPEIDMLEGWSLGARWWTRGVEGLYRRGLLTWKMHPTVIVRDDDAAERLLTVRGGRPRAALWGGLADPRLPLRVHLLWTPDRVEVQYNGTRVQRLTAERNPRTFERLNSATGGMNLFLNTYTTPAFTYDDYMYLGREMIVTDIRYRPL